MPNTELKHDDKVTFTCRIFGQLQGKITGFIRCLTNGQRHAVIRATLHTGEEIDCCEPVENLKVIK